MDSKIKKNYQKMTNQFKSTHVFNNKLVKTRDIVPGSLKHENADVGSEVSIDTSFEFVGAQPLTFSGQHIVDVTRVNAKQKRHCVFSPKLDGKRYLCLIIPGSISFISRNMDFLTFKKSKFDPIVGSVLLDVEVIGKLSDPNNPFDDSYSDSIDIFAFDVLFSDIDRRNETYLDRRILLEKIYKKIIPTFHYNGDRVFNFFINSSFKFSDLGKVDNKLPGGVYQSLIENKFKQIKELSRNGINFDGIIFYDTRSVYPKGDFITLDHVRQWLIPTHYGTWKWKPPEEQTIDLRIINGVPSYFGKSRNIIGKSSKGWINIIKSPKFNEITGIYESLTKSNSNLDLDLDNLTQSENESIEFGLVKINSDSDIPIFRHQVNYHLIPKLRRTKKANAERTILDVFESFKENINLKDIMMFGNPNATVDIYKKLNIDILNKLYIIVKNKHQINVYPTSSEKLFPDNQRKIKSDFENYKQNLNKMNVNLDPHYAGMGLLQYKQEIETLSLNSWFRNNVIGSIIYENFEKPIKLKTGIEILISDKLKELVDREISDRKHISKLEHQIELTRNNITETLTGAKDIPLTKKQLAKLKSSKDTVDGFPAFIAPVKLTIKSKNIKLNNEIETLMQDLKNINEKYEMPYDEPTLTEWKTAKMWYYKDKNGKTVDNQDGAFSSKEMKRLLTWDPNKNTVINKNTLVSNDGGQTWREVQYLFSNTGNAFEEESVFKLSNIFRQGSLGSRNLKYFDELKKLKSIKKNGMKYVRLRFEFGYNGFGNKEKFYNLLNNCKLDKSIKTIQSIIKGGNSSQSTDIHQIDYNTFEREIPKKSKLEIDVKTFGCKIYTIVGNQLDYRTGRFKSSKPYRSGYHVRGCKIYTVKPKFEIDSIGSSGNINLIDSTTRQCSCRHVRNPALRSCVWYISSFDKIDTETGRSLYNEKCLKFGIDYNDVEIYYIKNAILTKITKIDSIEYKIDLETTFSDNKIDPVDIKPILEQTL
jgi:hypothetical protein